jgi:predicted ester cyclase
MAEAKSTSAGTTPGKQPAKPRRSARAKAVEDAARAYFDAVAARDPDAMAAKWHPDGVEDLVPLGIFRGPDGVRDFFRELFAAIPDFAFTVERITADHELAAVQWRAAGTFDGAPFQGIDPTGRWIELRGTDCIEVDEQGLIVRNTAYYDGMAFARGVGLLPPEDSPADRALRTGFNAVTKVRKAVAGAR